MYARGVVLAGLVAFIAVGSPAPAQASSPTVRGCARPLLDGPARGEAAVRELGADLSKAAAFADRTNAELVDELRTDPTAWLDRCGRSFYVEPAVSAEQALVTAPTSNVPLDQAFALHSRLGSAHVLYLDFTGHLISGTGWNVDFAAGANINAAPYDTDGTPSSFSAAERAVVISVFQRVAEDYAPLDVDVTTVDPGEAAITRTSSSDLQYGTRALITNTSLACGGCAGVGYLDVFDSTYDHAYTQPALAFSSELGGSAKLIAETVSHEVGHNLGLSHDGTVTSNYFAGHAAWAPIMGASTNRPITQWSAGEYTGADNPQDDLSVMAGNGAPRLTDDHGDSAATATPSSGRDGGFIGTRTDTDWFSFTTSGGSTTITATPTAVGADLDLRVDLLDTSGAVVASANPASSTTYADPPTGLGSTLQVSALPAGAYTVRLDGVGSGSPALDGYSDYASLGRYALTIAAPSAGDSLLVATSALPGATVGKPWSALLQGTGGHAPYNWSLASGVLPAGVVLGPDGSLTGTPVATGSYPVTVTATDVTHASAERALTIVVRNPPVVTTTSLPATTRGRPYAAQLAATGGLAPYTWTRSTGSLPPGLTLGSTGRLAGTPTTAGTYALTAQVRDATGVTASRAFSIRINATLAVTTLTLPTARRGVAYSARLTTSGGTPALVWRVYAGTLPTGMRLSSTGVLSGVPTVATVRNVTFQATDGRGAIARRTLRVAVV